MMAPTTFGNLVVRCTISFGVHDFLAGSLKTSERLVGTFRGAGAGAGAATGAAAEGADEAGPAAGAGSAVERPAALKTSGISSKTAAFFRPAPRPRPLMNSGASRPRAMVSRGSPLIETWAGPEAGFS